MATGPAGATAEIRLSSEQLKRIEENRHRAREKLASRTQPRQPTLLSRPNSLWKQQQHHRQQPSTSQTHTHTHRTQFYSTNQKSTLNIHSKQPACTTTQHKPLPTACTQRDVTGNNLKYTQLPRPATIKANLRLVSRERFEIIIPYDKLAIEVFKKMPTNSYNAKTSVWSFGIEVYNKLIASLKKECQHIELNQIPRPVVSLFQSTRPAQSSTNNDDIWSKVGTKLSSTLMQFQRVGIDYCIGCGGRALLADDMGLGKTLQALAVMSYYRSNWPLLIICPSSVRMTWAEACQRWLSDLREDDVIVVFTSTLSTTSSPVTIISYDLATRLTSQLSQRRPDAIIVDESHFLKNHKTNRCKVILPLVKSATRCLLLSGTPALSRPIELHTQISALDKSFKMTHVNFGIRYCSGVKNNFGWDFSGASNLNELHLYMKEKFMIRRLKTEVLDQLPSKRRQTVLLDPAVTKTQSRDVCELRKKLEKASMCERRSALLPLFETTGRLKLPAVRDYILDILEGGRKLVVFGHHKSVLDSISQCLNNKGYDHIRIDGRTPVETRQLLCDRFQHDESCLVAVLSITTANAGLTLTASSTVVFAELFWNPGILVQAEDRVYRIGQKNCVNIHYLVAKETVDDFIWPLIQSKLTVLNKAGLAVDDFSSTESTLQKSDKSQQTLLDLFGKELDLEAEVEDDTDDSRDGDRDGSLSGGSNMKKKRKRETIDSYCGENDADISTQETHKKKKSHCFNSIPEQTHDSKKCTVSTTVVDRDNSEVGSGGSKGKLKDDAQSKAGDLASYLLSQQQSTCSSSKNTSTLLQVSLHQKDTKNNECGLTGKKKASSVTAALDSPESTTSTILYTASSKSPEDCDGDDWLLKDCDLTSFNDFDDEDMC